MRNGGICVMMSNSTLPLGFLHSNTELVTCGQLFSYLDIAFPVELFLVGSAGGCNEVDKLRNKEKAIIFRLDTAS